MRETRSGRRPAWNRAAENHTQVVVMQATGYEHSVLLIVLDLTCLSLFAIGTMKQCRGLRVSKI